MEAETSQRDPDVYLPSARGRAPFLPDDYTLNQPDSFSARDILVQLRSHPGLTRRKLRWRAVLRFIFRDWLHPAGDSEPEIAFLPS